ncbi:hypothetical protein BDN72DRAFT_596420 [Pluteus cervinus]|uniref:Uncharacterized protein n=1 Tax=Pluteus cervinus TaxID=181527 RepID=A0ACD3AVQ3_9AGAR|nr:hypothetical protein BDN72DRAFT_596420 [Pluteus cervinus]
MHCLLKGIAFLHENKIVHRVSVTHHTIRSSHIWVLSDRIRKCAHNHFSNDYFPEPSARIGLRSRGLLTYALFDFGLSIPPSVDNTTYRLPYQLSWDGSEMQPNDTAQGEFDYDPFAFDIGTLGNVFCRTFQYCCQDLPMLAPFLDKMVTRDIPRRFTASQALNFFETQVLTQLPAKQLQHMYIRWEMSAPYDE